MLALVTSVTAVVLGNGVQQTLTKAPHWHEVPSSVSEYQASHAILNSTLYSHNAPVNNDVDPANSNRDFDHLGNYSWASHVLRSRHLGHKYLCLPVSRLQR